jgi:L-ascorbate metabolism protein UlaG (beta-lactamase superfamily)
MRLAALALALLPAPAFAEIMPSHCVALSMADPDIHYVALDDGRTDPGEVKIHFVGHATFLVETAAGIRIATDFTGFVGPGVTPDVVTMNKAHSSHYTLTPDPAIPHVLHGWGTGPDDPADHFLELADVVVRNVTTDIRSWNGREDNANSIFVFETAGLCIGHLGHLHHEPSDVQYALMGRLDVVMAPVDGGYTMDQAAMTRVLKRVKARLVLPMHWFGEANLARFLADMRDEFEVVQADRPDVTMSLDGLPRTPTVMVLWPATYRPDID